LYLKFTYFDKQKRQHKYKNVNQHWLALTSKPYQ